MIILHPVNYSYVAVFILQKIQWEWVCWKEFSIILVQIRYSNLIRKQLRKTLKPSIRYIKVCVRSLISPLIVCVIFLGYLLEGYF